MKNESDVRRKYRELMNESHYRFPKKTVLAHRIEWYLDGHLERTPLVAVYAYANLAEYFLHFTRFGKRRQAGAFREVEEFFALTRRTMQNVLSTYPIGRRLNRTEREAASKTAARLCVAANETYEAVRAAAKPCKCPLCKGSGTLFPADAELLEAILCEHSRDGSIPPTSALYRISVVDKIPRTVV